MTEQVAHTHHQLRQRVDEHHRLLHGEDGRLGIVGKVAVLWHSQMWIVALLCTVVGKVSGALLTWLLIG